MGGASFCTLRPLSLTELLCGPGGNCVSRAGGRKPLISGKSSAGWGCWGGSLLWILGSVLYQGMLCSGTIPGFYCSEKLWFPCEFYFSSAHRLGPDKSPDSLHLLVHLIRWVLNCCNCPGRAQLGTFLHLLLYQCQTWHAYLFLCFSRVIQTKKMLKSTVENNIGFSFLAAFSKRAKRKHGHDKQMWYVKLQWGVKSSVNQKRI